MAGVSTFVQPNFTGQTATVYKTSIDDAVAVHHQIAGPFAPHEKSVPDLQVLIDAAAFSVLATRVQVTINQQTTATFTAPTTNPRNDIISADVLTGVISITAGVEDASPVDPVFTADEIPIARVRLVVSMTEITNADIDDIRLIGPLGLGTVVSFDTGTAAGEIPKNSDLGTASLIDTGAAAGEIGLNAEAFVDRTAAATTNIGANTSLNVRIIGTTTITAFDNVASGLRRKVRFADALTLTHNGTSLILPSVANILTAADDTAEFISLGSGNWLCLDYKKADGAAIVATPAGLVLLASASPSAAASVDFTSFIDSTFNRYLFIGDNLRPATDAVELWVRTDSDSGASFDAGAVDYGWSVTGRAATTDLATGSSGDTKINLTGGIRDIGNLSDEGISFTLWLSDPSIAAMSTRMFWQTAWSTNTGISAFTSGGGERNAAQAVDAIQFLFSGGNITSGEIRMYGIKEI